MRRAMGLCCALVVLAGYAAAAAAGDIADLAASAEAKLQAGKSVEAIDDLRKALRVANTTSPLAFRKATFVSEPPQGWGIYKPRANNVFKKGEPLVAYVEPVGVGWSKEGDGIFHSLLTVDFEIRSPKGDILTGKRDFGRFEFRSREENTEVMTHLTLNVSGAGPGSYVFGVTYHDKITGKSANVDLPFEIK